MHWNLYVTRGKDSADVPLLDELSHESVACRHPSACPSYRTSERTHTTWPFSQSAVAAVGVFRRCPGSHEREHERGLATGQPAVSVVDRQLCYHLKKSSRTVVNSPRQSSPFVIPGCVARHTTRPRSRLRALSLEPKWLRVQIAPQRKRVAQAQLPPSE